MYSSNQPGSGRQREVYGGSAMDTRGSTLMGGYPTDSRGVPLEQVRPPPYNPHSNENTAFHSSQLYQNAQLGQTSGQHGGHIPSSQGGQHFLSYTGQHPSGYGQQQGVYGQQQSQYEQQQHLGQQPQYNGVQGSGGFNMSMNTLNSGGGAYGGNFSQFEQPQDQSSSFFGQSSAQNASFQFPNIQQLGNNPLGAQLLTSTMQSFVPAYTNQFFRHSSESMNQFMRLPKYYFSVNNQYVLRKIGLLLFPFTHKTWKRKRFVDPTGLEGTGADGAATYLPPRDDINAPDLYIPVMAFVSYVLLVGFILGTQGKFKAEVMASTSSVGLGMLTLEVLLIKLGLYLINAKPTRWLDIVAFRGYKFVGVNLAMVASLLIRPSYYLVLGYTAFAMGVFLMRSHRAIVLPRGGTEAGPDELTKRNYFLFFILALQFPIYWLLGVQP